MAGIVGYRMAGARAVPAVLLDDLASALRHRGPDAFGAWWDRDAGVALGHRLARRDVRDGTVLGRPIGESSGLEDPLGSVGAAPATSRSGRWVVVFDGRIHNARDLFRALGDGASGSSAARRTCSEGHGAAAVAHAALLAESFERWGVDAALERLDAAFAFVAWDRHEHRLVLARDAFGQRPLVYASTGSGLAFASELGALRRLPGFDSSLDPAAVASFLRFKYVPSPHTIHPGAHKLPAGHVLTVAGDDLDVGLLPEPRRLRWFGTLLDDADRETARAPRVAPEHGGGADERRRELLDELDRALVRSVRSRLFDDAPGGMSADASKCHGDRTVGALLSGGIDSALVSTIAAELSSEPIRTFTVGSEDADLDESSEARAIASHLGADHTEIRVGGADAAQTVPDLAGYWDEPFADSSQLPMLLVSRLARTRVSAVLAGDGGDELFGGYNRHLWLPRTWGRVGSIPRPLRRGASRMLQMPPPRAWEHAARLLPRGRRPRMMGLKVQKLASVLGAADEADAYGQLVSHWQDPASLLDPRFTEDVTGTGDRGENRSSTGSRARTAGAAGIGFGEPLTLAHDASRWPRAGSLAETIMAVDLCTYLPDDVLVKVDRATAAAGLEARAPLLGREVVKRSFALPVELKIDGGMGKRALRHLIGRRLPAQLVGGPKSGFGVPIAAWLRGPLRPWAEDLLSESSLRRGAMLRPAPIRAAWSQHQAGHADRSFELWDVLMLLSWTSRYVMEP